MRLRLPCGCPTIVNFDKGERRVVCEGEGLSPADDGLKWNVCPGGRAYAVAAEEVTTVTYKVRPLHVFVEEAV